MSNFENMENVENTSEISDGVNDIQRTNGADDVTDETLVKSRQIAKGIGRVAINSGLIIVETWAVLFLMGMLFVSIIIFPLRKPILKGISALTNNIIKQVDGIVDAITYKGSNVVMKIVSAIFRILVRAFAIILDLYALMLVIGWGIYGLVPLLIKGFRAPFKNALRGLIRRIKNNIKGIFNAIIGREDGFIGSYGESEVYGEKDGEHVLKKDGTWDMRYNVNKQE